MKRITIVMLILLLSGCGGPQQTTVRQHLDFDADKKQSIKSIALLPVSVEINSLELSGALTRLRPKENSMHLIFRQELQTLAQKNGVILEIVQNNFIESNSDEMENFNKLLDEKIRIMYPGMGSVINTTPNYLSFHSTIEQAHATKHTIGDVANIIAIKAQSDYLLSCDLQWREKSRGLIAMEISLAITMALLFVPTNPTPDNKGLLNCALIDGSNGNILWTNVNYYISDIQHAIENDMDDFFTIFTDEETASRVFEQTTPAWWQSHLASLQDSRIDG